MIRQIKKVAGILAIAAIGGFTSLAIYKQTEKPVLFGQQDNVVPLKRVSMAGNTEAAMFDFTEAAEKQYRQLCTLKQLILHNL